LTGYIDAGVIPAIIAVILYAFSEAILHYLSHILGAWPTFLFRMPAMYAIIVILILILRRSIPSLFNLKIRIVAARSALSGLTFLFFTMSFAFTVNQSFTYIYFSYILSLQYYFPK